MREFLDTIQTPYVDAQTLLSMLHDYTNPRDCIARMVKNGLLLRLKNGFFLIKNRFSKDLIDIPYEQIANLLYGPSYISLEWALSFYNFIPERVVDITSVTTGSPKKFQTSIGTFSYKHLSLSRYSIGVSYHQNTNEKTGFLLATPEKALLDWVFFSAKNLDERELLEDLIEAKRIEREKLMSLDVPLLETISSQYRSKEAYTLCKVVKKL